MGVDSEFSSESRLVSLHVLPVDVTVLDAQLGWLRLNSSTCVEEQQDICVHSLFCKEASGEEFLNIIFTSFEISFDSSLLSVRETFDTSFLRAIDLECNAPFCNECSEIFVSSEGLDFQGSVEISSPSTWSDDNVAKGGEKTCLSSLQWETCFQTLCFDLYCFNFRIRFDFSRNLTRVSRVLLEDSLFNDNFDKSGSF